MEPVMSPSPNALAPSMVAMETTSFAGNALRSWSSFLWKFSHIRIWMNRSNVFPLAGPSVPKPTDMPCLCISDTGATPFAAFVLEAMQWATDAPCFARISTSCSVVRMLWAASVFGPRTPICSINSMGVMLYCSLNWVIS